MSSENTGLHEAIIRHCYELAINAGKKGLNLINLDIVFL